jgi:hypothetical protein
MQTISLHSCTESAFSISANIAFMGQIDDDHKLIKELVDWAERGFPSRVAANIGAAATTITRHYNGKATTRLGRDTLAKLREKYPDFPGWDKAGNTKVRSEVADFRERPFEEIFGSGELASIPVVGSALGMASFDPERDIELTELDTTEILDRIRRPASLANDGDAYAVTIVGDSMWPRFRPGRRVIVSPRSPVSIHDDVVVQLKGEDPEDQYSERVTLVLIKELVRRSATFIELRQFNPDVTFRVDSKRVAAMHKVIGEVY